MNETKPPMAFLADHGPRMSDMTLRDYFAAHAPKRPQPWFHPTMRVKPEAIHGCTHTAEHSPRCGGWEYCSPDNWRERDQWDADERTERLKQWPYAWADAMLAERSEP